MKSEPILLNTSEPVDPIKFLESQHREVEELFEKIEKTSDRATKTRNSLFAVLATKIELHAQIEEKVLYPAGKPVDEDTTLEAYEEHALVRDMIKKVQKTKSSDETFMAKVTLLKELIEHHVKEEESEYFPKLKEKLGDEALADLGLKLKRAHDRLKTPRLVRTRTSSRGTSSRRKKSA
jgi:hemerythrin superfamily protein